MSEALGSGWTSRFRPAEGLAVDLIASRLPEEEAFTRLTQLVWTTIEEMFSGRTITPGTTRTSDLVWFWRQRINDLARHLVPAVHRGSASRRDSRAAWP